MAGKHIEIFLVDGAPGGIITAEITNWSGSVLKGPRSELAKLLARDEAQRNGVYFLLGEDETSIENTRCYIGKTENLANRIKNHAYNRDDWDSLVLISSKDSMFNEGHWLQLESRLIYLAKEAARATLPNIVYPQPRKLSEAQLSDVESFIAELRIILPVLGVNVLRSTKQTKAAEATIEESPIFTLTASGINAKAQVVGGEFILLQGSVIVPTWRGGARTAATKATYKSLKDQFDELVAVGAIRVEDGSAVVAQNIPFKSPSRAAAIALGRSSNGRAEWAWGNKTYADWEERGL